MVLLYFLTQRADPSGCVFKGSEACSEQALLKWAALVLLSCRPEAAAGDGNLAAWLSLGKFLEVVACSSFMVGSGGK